MVDNSGRKVVVFDLGGVLLDHDPRYLYRKLFATESEMDEFLATVCTQSWNERQDAGRALSEATATLKAEHPDKAELIDAYYGRWPEMLSGAIDGTVGVLKDLRERDVPLYSLTNFSAETFPIAEERFEFFKWFKGIVVSGAVGVKKPDPKIFEILFETFGFKARDAVFIDDTMKNVEAANTLGVQGIHFTNAATLRRDLAGLGFL